MLSLQILGPFAVLMVGKVTALSPLPQEASPRGPPCPGRSLAPPRGGGAAPGRPPFSPPAGLHPCAEGMASTLSPALPPASMPWALHDQRGLSRTCAEDRPAPRNFRGRTAHRGLLELTAPWPVLFQPRWGVGSQEGEVLGNSWASPARGGVHSPAS